MELAFHLRDLNQEVSQDILPDILISHLCGFYQEDLHINGFADQFETICRLYTGDEFCFHRLPSLNEMQRFCRFTKKNNAGMTFLTPPMTDRHLKKCAPLFACLENDCENAEVVANDPGVLLYVRKNYPGLHLTAGRLFNKGFKDPRFPYSVNAGSLSEAMHNALSESTFYHQGFLEHLSSIGVRRIEQDILPYGSGINRNDSKMHVSLYFPFGVVTTGRLCQAGSRGKQGREKFLISEACASPCMHQILELTHESFQFRLFQNGNTIYYLYPSALLNNLFHMAEEGSFRLVYQGLAL
jgi:hypothetical protein